MGMPITNLNVTGKNYSVSIDKHMAIVSDVQAEKEKVKLRELTLSNLFPLLTCENTEIRIETVGKADLSKDFTNVVLTLRGWNNSVERKTVESKQGIIGKITPHEKEMLGIISQAYQLETNPDKKDKLHQAYDELLERSAEGYINASIPEELILK